MRERVKSFKECFDNKYLAFMSLSWLEFLWGWHTGTVFSNFLLIYNLSFLVAELIVCVVDS